MQQGVHRRPLRGGQLPATVRPETTRGPPPQRREADQRALLVPGHLQLQDQQGLARTIRSRTRFVPKCLRSVRSNQRLPKTRITSSDHQKNFLAQSSMFVLKCYCQFWDYLGLDRVPCWAQRLGPIESPL